MINPFFNPLRVSAVHVWRCRSTPLGRRYTRTQNEREMAACAQCLVGSIDWSLERRFVGFRVYIPISQSDLEDESSSSDEVLESTSGSESEIAGTSGTSRKRARQTETEWKIGTNFSPSVFLFDASTSGQLGSSVFR